MAPEEIADGELQFLGLFQCQLVVYVALPLNNAALA
jgi:hypothetical protein